MWVNKNPTMLERAKGQRYMSEVIRIELTEGEGNVWNVITAVQPGMSLKAEVSGDASDALSKAIEKYAVLRSLSQTGITLPSTSKSSSTTTGKTAPKATYRFSVTQIPGNEVLVGTGWFGREQYEATPDRFQLTLIRADGVKVDGNSADSADNAINQSLLLLQTLTGPAAGLENYEF
jgi:hypothetical protein